VIFLFGTSDFSFLIAVSLLIGCHEGHTSRQKRAPHIQMVMMIVLVINYVFHSVHWCVCVYVMLDPGAARQRVSVC